MKKLIKKFYNNISEKTHFISFILLLQKLIKSMKFSILFIMKPNSKLQLVKTIYIGCSFILKKVEDSGLKIINNFLKIYVSH